MEPDRIAILVLREMVRKDMTILELAAYTGVHRCVLGRWLSGRRTLRVRHLLPVLDELGLEVVAAEDPHGRRCAPSRRS